MVKLNSILTEHEVQFSFATLLLTPHQLYQELKGEENKKKSVKVINVATDLTL